MYPCHLFLISSASVRSISFLSFTVPIFAWKYSLGISNFPEEISTLPHSIVFLYFLALFSLEGFLISRCYSSEFCIYGYIFPFLLCLFFLFFSQLFVRPPQTAILHFFFLGMVLITTTFCTMLWTSIHRSSGTWSIRSNCKHLLDQRKSKRIPCTEEPGGLLSIGLHRVGHYWSDLAAAAEISSRKLEIPREHFMQRWAQ